MTYVHCWISSGRLRVLAGVVCSIILLVSTLPLAAASLASRTTVVIGMAQEPDALGRFSVMSAARVVENALFAFVAPYTDRWVRQPVLVEHLPTLQNGLWQLLPGGKMRVTWRLRRGFTWHDGRPVTALDFRFTYGMLRNPLTPGVSRFVLSKVDHVFIPDLRDPYALIVQWDEGYPFAGTLPFGEQVVFPRHLLESAYLKDPTRLPVHPYWRAPVGNGPYRFVEWIPGSHITLEAYPSFPLGPPKIQRIVFRFILDSTVLQTAVLTHQVDATEVNNFGVPEMLEIERRAPDVATHYTPSLRWERINFNLDNEWLKDRRVRQAIAYAIDREAIVRALFAGRYQVAHGWLAPRHPAHNPRVRRYAYDSQRAMTLLLEAGFTPGPDGILRDRQGRRAEMTITGYEGFHSSQIPSEANNWEGFNVMGWRSLENDRLLEQIGGELDEARRNRLLKRQQEIFAEDLPALPLYFTMSLTTSRKELRNVRPTGLFGSFLPWNAYEWSWQE